MDFLIDEKKLEINNNDFRPTKEEACDNAIEAIIECLAGFNKKECEYIIFIAKNKYFEDLKND